MSIVLEIVKLLQHYTIENFTLYFLAFINLENLNIRI